MEYITYQTLFGSTAEQLAPVQHTATYSLVQLEY